MSKCRVKPCSAVFDKSSVALQLVDHPPRRLVCHILQDSRQRTSVLSESSERPQLQCCRERYMQIFNTESLPALSRLSCFDPDKL